MGNYRKAHYRKRNGDRLSASEYKARRKREIIFHFALMIAILLFCIIGLVLLIKKVTHKKEEVVPPDNSTEELTVVDTIVKEEEKKEEENPFLKKSEDASSFFEGYEVSLSDDTAYISSENTISTYALLLDLDNGKVIASKDGNVKINPASMTKILTLLVAVEHIDSLDDTFAMTQGIGN